MLSTQEDPNSHFKLAQLRHLVANPSLTSKTNSNNIALARAVNELLTDDVNINYKVTINPYRQKWKIHLKDCTALHFLASEKHDIDVFNMLLVRGADFTIKNENGQTALHLVTTNYLNKLKKFSTIKNRNAPVDFPVTNIFRIKDPKINHNSIINSVLSAHVKFQNSVNPLDSNGLSHLHAACIANHVKALALFLENGASVDEAVNFDAPQFAGYNPLHFAVTFHSFEVTEMLMSRAANINAQTAEGLTPLDIAVKHVLNNYEDLFPEDSKQTLQDEILKNEKIIKIFLEKQCIPTIGLSSLHVACTLKDLTTAEQLLDQGANINYAVPMKSPLCPGNTALHFAAYNSIEAVKMLMKRGAKLDVGNAKGFTPLDICVDKYSLQEICDVASCDENWKTICMTDKKTSLLDFMRVGTELLQFKVFLQSNMQNMAVPSDSLILPGCTMLHLAVVFSMKNMGENQNNKFNDNIVREYLKIGLDVNTPNARGQTPIHLAFRLGKDNIVELLLKDLDKLDQLVDLVDEDNLSYLHIACAMEDESLVNELLKTSTPNVAYKGRSVLMEMIESGTTPLHVAAAYGSQPMVEMLLKHGADLHAIDSNGMTPIHHLLQLEGSRIGEDVVKVLFNALLENSKDCVVDQVGLNYLHIACYVGHVEAVKTLLDIGSNVNAVISYQNSSDERNLSRQQLRLLDFPMCTPLHLANYRPVVEIIELLMRRGADMFAAANKFSVRHIKPLESPVILKNKDITRIFVSVLWEESELQKRMEERWGLTRLHIACHMKNEEAIKSLLKDGFDVNSQMHTDAEVFAGCTPLHLLLTVSTCYIFVYYHYRPAYSLNSMIRLLLDHGADVTIANAKKNTPVHLLSRAYSTDNMRYAETLLNAQKDFGINPVNAQGESHFHIACKWLFVEVIEKFLQHGTVDVNQRDDPFAKRGETPLHYTCWQDFRGVDWAKFSQTIDMLFAHGADPAVKDAQGETPLHKPGLTRVPNMIEVMDKFIRHGADIKSENIMGQTILDKWNILNPLMDYESLFIKYGYPINSWNNITGEGYIGRIFLSQIHKAVKNNTHFQKLVQSSPDARAVDKLGRTFIHNSVAVLPPKYQGVENYVYAIECFISQGVDIDHQDQSGQTALHYAVQMENKMGVEALLKCGADINITDDNDRPAFSYYTEYNKGEIVFSGVKKIVNMLNCHVRKLQHLKLEVNQINENLVAGPQLIRCRVLDDIRHEDPNTVLQPFFSQVKMAKTLDVGVRSLTLFDFMNEMGGVTLYSYLSTSEQNIIDDFFKSIAAEEFGDLMGIIKLQFRKMKARLALIDAALTSLRKLLGFSFPGLCEEISRYLTNTDLKNLMAC